MWVVNQLRNSVWAASAVRTTEMPPPSSNPGRPAGPPEAPARVRALLRLESDTGTPWSLDGRGTRACLLGRPIA